MRASCERGTGVPPVGPAGVSPAPGHCGQDARWPHRRDACATFFFLLLLAALPLARAEETPSVFEAVSREVRGIYERSSGAVCTVEADDEHGRVRGTGFLVDATGTLFTSYSVGGETEDIVVTLGEEKYPATRLVADARSGLAVLHVEADQPLPFLPSGKARELAIASPLVALGYPLEMPLSPSFGIVAGFDIGFQGRFFATRHIRANLPVQKGEGGAPILNIKGEVVGVLISTLEGGSGLFALPMEAAQKVLADFHRHGRIRQGWLGVDVRVTDAPEHGSSARIRNLRTDGPGHKGNLRPGDVLLQIGDWKITSPEDVLNAAFYLSAEDPVLIRISRAGHEHRFTIVPGDAPDGESPVVQRQEPPAIGATTGLDLGR